MTVAGVQGSDRSGRRTPTEIAVYGLAAYLALAAILQCLLVLVDRSMVVPRIPALLSSVAALVGASAVLSGKLVRGRWPVLVLLLATCAGFVVWHARTASVPFDHRLLLLATLLVLATAVLHVMLLPLPWPRVPERLLMLSTLLLGLFGAEAVLGLAETDTEVPASGVMTGVRWEGTLLPDSVLGERYAPYSQVATYYPDNPRGYFEVVDPRVAMWQLATHGGVGSLEVVATDSLLFRLTVESGTPGEGSTVQVNMAGIPIVSGNDYRLRFRARAVPARSVSVAVSRAHPPWSGLGLYREFHLAAEWRDFEATFTANGSSENARVHFDAGGSPATIEVAEVSLVDIASGNRLQPEADTAYRVVYHFNAQGCRGPDRAIPAPDGTVRILALGDSYMMGVGVHEPDALPAQLEGILNARAVERGDTLRYEVVNCGVSGYSTREERLFYQRIGRVYQPDLVLLGIVLNDDVSWVEEQRRGWVWLPGRMDHLSVLWMRARQYRHSRPERDFSAVPVELLALDSVVRADGARLVPFLFRNHEYDHFLSGPLWDSVRTAASTALARMGSPVIDVGDALIAGEDVWDLFVHRLDLHPNEVANARVARELLKVLDRLGVLVQAPVP